MDEIINNMAGANGEYMGVVGTVFSIFMLLFIGYASKKARILRAQDADLLNTVVIYFTLPAFIFDAIYSFREPLPWSMVKVPIFGFAMIAVVLVIAYLVGRIMRLDRPTLGGMIVASGFGNTGFLGYPVVTAAFGGGGALVTAALYDELAMAVPLYTLGALICATFAGRQVDKRQLMTVLTLPALWAIPIALVLRPIALPEPLLDALRYLGAGTIPLVMLSLGLTLSARSLHGYLAPALAVIVMKLAMLPILTHYTMQAVGVTGVVYQATVLESAMPTAVMASVIAAKFGANAKFVAGVIFITTLLSLATIPITLILLGVG